MVVYIFNWWGSVEGKRGMICSSRGIQDARTSCLLAARRPMCVCGVLSLREGEGGDDGRIVGGERGALSAAHFVARLLLVKLERVATRPIGLVAGRYPGPALVYSDF